MAGGLGKLLMSAGKLAAKKRSEQQQRVQGGQRPRRSFRDRDGDGFDDGAFAAPLAGAGMYDAFGNPIGAPVYALGYPDPGQGYVDPGYVDPGSQQYPQDGYVPPPADGGFVPDTGTYDDPAADTTDYSTGSEAPVDDSGGGDYDSEYDSDSGSSYDSGGDSGGYDSGDSGGGGE